MLPCYISDWGFFCQCVCLDLFVCGLSMCVCVTGMFLYLTPMSSHLFTHSFPMCQTGIERIMDVLDPLGYIRRHRKWSNCIF